MSASLRLGFAAFQVATVLRARHTLQATDLDRAVLDLLATSGIADIDGDCVRITEYGERRLAELVDSARAAYFAEAEARSPVID